MCPTVPQERRRRMPDAAAMTVGSQRVAVRVDCTHIPHVVTEWRHRVCSKYSGAVHFHTFIDDFQWHQPRDGDAWSLHGVVVRVLSLWPWDPVVWCVRADPGCICSSSRSVRVPVVRFVDRSGLKSSFQCPGFVSK